VSRDVAACGSQAISSSSSLDRGACA
jgi:hypothetical protein